LPGLALPAVTHFLANFGKRYGVVTKVKLSNAGWPRCSK